MNLVIKSTPHAFDLHSSYIIQPTDLIVYSVSFKKKNEAKFVSAGSAEIFAKTRKYFITFCSANVFDFVFKATAVCS